VARDYVADRRKTIPGDHALRGLADRSNFADNRITAAGMWMFGREGAMSKLGFGLAVIFLAMLLAGCGSVVGNANAGPNPGGGFYDGPNLDVGRINP
jgi:hypothetical protein